MPTATTRRAVGLGQHQGLPHLAIEPQRHQPGPVQAELAGHGALDPDGHPDAADPRRHGLGTR